MQIAGGGSRRPVRAEGHVLPAVNNSRQHLLPQTPGRSPASLCPHLAAAGHGHLHATAAGRGLRGGELERCACNPSLTCWGKRSWDGGQRLRRPSGHSEALEFWEGA